MSDQRSTGGGAGGIDRLCSKCGTHLQEQFNGRVTVDICPNCRGVYLDSGELDETLAQDGLTRYLAGLEEVCYHCRYSPKEGERVFPICPSCGRENKPYACPGCQDAMRPVIFHDVLLEVCPGCFGLYLDRRELGAVAQKLEQQGGGVANGREGYEPAGFPGAGAAPRPGAPDGAAAGFSGGAAGESNDGSAMEMNTGAGKECAVCGDELKLPYYTAEGLVCHRCFKKKDIQKWGAKKAKGGRDKSEFGDFLLFLLTPRYGRWWWVQ